MLKKSVLKHFFTTTVLCLAAILSACGGGGSSSPPGPQNPNTPTLSASLTTAQSGLTISFTGAATDPGNLTLTYAWNFGDNTSATGTNTSHAYSAAGTYTVRLTATNSGGASASNTLSIVVTSNSSDFNSFVIDCAVTGCGASNPTTYSGSGTGVWRYSNTNATDAVIDVNIGGVTAGKTVTLLFSNGGMSTVANLPNTGILAQPVLSLAEAAKAVAAVSITPAEKAMQERRAAHDAAHDWILKDNARLANLLRDMPRSPLSARSDAAPPVPQAGAASPVIGATRTWTDSFDPATPTNYPTTAKAVCPVANGRNAVVWVDPNAMSAGNVTDANVAAIVAAFCGNTGGAARLTTLLGDVWGAHVYPTYLISDTPLQDLNIVIIEVPSSTTWAGYFYSLNNFLKSAPQITGAANSNEALVFFIDASQLIKDEKYILSTLLHEATHMVNYYQRSIRQGTSPHDTWLEETSAMMSEDIVTPSVVKNTDSSDYNKIATYRLPSYLRTGGAVSYITWPTLSDPNYAMGGSFGAYLNRRYGLAIYQQLLSGCPLKSTSSYSCLDTLIKNNSGQGFEDEFAHFGASIFGLLPATGMPSKFGFPTRTDGGYTLMPIDVSAMAASLPAPSPLISYTATTHTYKVDTVAAGKTNYVRSGVVVPANTTLLVVVR